MTAVTSPPLVGHIEQEALPDVAERQPAARTVPLCQPATTWDAEHLRALLILSEIHVANIEGDPISCGLAVAEILVLSAEHARAAAIVEEYRAGDASAEWGCFNCGETVPGNFDVCWNCCERRGAQ